jgi:3-(3-hydroxy-phenyl)propionate hydroxylase
LTIYYFTVNLMFGPLTAILLPVLNTRVIRGELPASFLDTYDEERLHAADENIRNSTRSTDFITPKNAAARAYRDAVLALSAQAPLARPLVNSGRLSRPAVLRGSPLNTPGGEDSPLPPGAPAADAPVLDRGRPDWLLRHLGGNGFTLLALAGEGAPPPAVPEGVARVVVGETETTGALFDHSGLVARRWGLRPGEAVLLRPDQHVAARFAAPDPVAIAAARDRALGRAP